MSGKWRGKKVAVLYGGRSTEREVALESGSACAEALRQKGYHVALVDVDLEVAARLREVKAEVAFVALHGRWGEDGCIQGLLESMAIPYTGSGVLASSVGMDKVFSKALFRSLGLRVVDYVVFPAGRVPTVTVGDLPFGLPCVVKPSGEGSSVGVHLVKDAAALPPACRDAARYKGEVLVERHVRGKEIQVAVLDGKALGAIEIEFAGDFYDYEAKYRSEATRFFYPARLPPAHLRAVLEAGEIAHRGLGCAGVTRADFIVSTDGTPFLLETNTLPGMTSHSLVPKIAAGNGISFPDLCERILEGAALQA